MQRNEKLSKWISRVAGYLKPVSRMGAAISIVCSFLIVFAFFCAVAPKWYGEFQTYSELITGLTTFSGYNKDADMKVVKVLLMGIPVLFFGINGMIRFCMDRLCMNRKKSFHGQILKKRILPKYVSAESLKQLAVNALLLYGSIQSIVMAVCSILVGRKADAVSTEGYLFIAGASVAAVLLYACLYVKKECDLLSHRRAFQLLLPFGLGSLVFFRYRYELTGEIFTLFYSSVYKYFIYGIIILFFGYAVYGFVKKKTSIYAQTVIILAVLRSFIKPEGVLSIDYFHMGEMSTPFQQLESFGKIPFWDVMPIHGACDYYYSLINRIFLDGTYLSLNAAIAIGNLFLAALLAMVLYKTCHSSGMALVISYFFMPFMINGAGIRYIFMFVMFFVLFSEKVRKDCLKYIWWYVMLSVIAITWNVSIGGATAAAFFVGTLIFYVPKLPGRLKNLFMEGESKEKRNFILAYAFLICFGIAFIPLFLKIVIYLKENAGTTLMANGMAMVEDMENYRAYFTPTLFPNGDVSFLHIFGFMIPFALCLMLGTVTRNQTLKRMSAEVGIILFVFLYIIANYAFVRFDSGLRTGVISCFSFILILCSFVYEWCRIQNSSFAKSGLILVFLAAIYMCGDSVRIDTKEIVADKEVESFTEATIMGRTVEDPVVYVTGDSVSMKYLGNGFMSGNALKNLQNIQYVLRSELLDKKEYLDMTNAVANYVFMDCSMVLPYTSGYNISNEEMQKNAIEILKEKEPELILLAPFIRFDEATISLRSPKLYEYFLDAGFKPYVYENVIYMKKGNSNLYAESNGWEDFAQLMHKEALQMLPAVWGNSDFAGLLDKVEVKSSVMVSEESVTLSFEEQISGSDIDFIQIKLKDGEELKEETELFLRFSDEKEYGFTFYRKGNSFLLPVFSSPYFKEMDKLDNMSLTVKEGDADALGGLKECELIYYQYK